MDAKEIAAALGGHDYERSEHVLASLGPSSGDDVAKAIRSGFKGGDEQGNARRLTALVKIEGSGALDVVRAVLEDTEEVGGIYSNLRSTAFELIHAHFLGDLSLENPLWKGIELDKEFLDAAQAYELVAPYDPTRALELLVPQAKQGVPRAVQALAKNPAGRPTLIVLLDAALDGDGADAFIEALGEHALAPDLIAKISAHASVLPAAAILVARTDEAFARELAEKITSKDHGWRGAATRALARLPQAEIFDRVSALLEVADRAKPKALERLEAIAEHLPALTDARWLEHLRARLAVEESPKVRAHVVTLLGKTGPAALDAILAAPRDDKDTHVIAAMGDAIGAMTADERVVAKVKAAVDAAGKKGKRAKILREALHLLTLEV